VRCHGLFGYSSAGILDRCFQPQCVAQPFSWRPSSTRARNLSLILVGL
jgi:hypothetical protein